MLACFAAALAAQVHPVAISGGLHAQAGAAAPQSLPPGLDVSAGAWLTANAAQGQARIAAQTAVTSAAVTIDWNVASVASGSSSSSTQATIRYELWTALPQVGRLVVAWAPVQSGTGTAACSIDVGDDGSVEATGGAVLPVAFGPGPLVVSVRCTTAAFANVVAGPWGSQWSYQGSAQAALQIRLEAAHCQTSVIGPGCGSPLLAATGNLAGGADLRAVFSPAADLAVLALGFDRISQALPMAPGCPLRTTPVVVLWSAVGPSRVVDWSLALPPAVRPLSFAAQAGGIDVDVFSATTSDGLWLVLQ